jgi:predicted nucleic acid-binding protein
MNERAFIDTNVFIYLYSEDEPEKQSVSQRAVNKYNCVISTQVLNEFSSVCLGKLNKPTEEVELAVNELCEHCTVSLIEKHFIKQALGIHKSYGYSYYDSLMIVSALNSDCRYFLTEDLSDGQVINNELIIVNIYSERNINKYL